MKENIYKELVGPVCNQFGITTEQLYDSSQEYAQARGLLFFMCWRRQIRVMDIKRYYEKYGGHEMSFQNYYNTIERWEQKHYEDRDIRKIVEKLQRYANA